MDHNNQLYERVRQFCRETALLASIESLLGWDERTIMPPAAGEYRAEQATYVAGLLHSHRTAPQLGDWLEELSQSSLATDPYSDAGATIRELKRQYDKKVRLPKSLVEELTRTAVLGQQLWVEARRNDDFHRFRPVLEKTFALKRDEAEALGYEDCPYDALLDEFEPGESTANVSRTLSGLREELVPLVSAIGQSRRRPRSEILSRRFPIEQQNDFGRRVAEEIGFDFRRGRLDVTAHPFCSGIAPHDCRITTRFDEQYFPTAFFGILHEAGHGMYDQGLRPDEFGLPLGEAASLGIHESQSRMWENLVGRSQAFWEHFFPLAQKAFPDALEDVALDDFVFAVNEVRPSLIRVEADEATYNLHILVRFELEQALLAGDLPAADLPGAWKEKYRDYLGIEPENDADGVLQDIHWSGGLVGYFPTYSLGNVYAAQLFDRADEELGGLDAEFARGEFQPLRDWLRGKVHASGKRFAATELVRQVTGRPVSHDSLVSSLRIKMGRFYDLG